VLRVEQHIDAAFVGHDIILKFKIVLLKLVVGTKDVGVGKLISVARTNGRRNKVE
jgi:hypothetical protein